MRLKRIKVGMTLVIKKPMTKNDNKKCKVVSVNIPKGDRSNATIDVTIGNSKETISLRPGDLQEQEFSAGEEAAYKLSKYV